MAVRFHLSSEIFDHRNASEGVERGNILSWRQDLKGGIAGAPLDFGATIGTKSVLRRTLGLFALAILAGLSVIVSVLFLLARRGRKRRGGSRGSTGPKSRDGTADDAAFLNYDPTSSIK